MGFACAMHGMMFWLEKCWYLFNFFPARYTSSSFSNVYITALLVLANGGMPCCQKDILCFRLLLWKKNWILKCIMMYVCLFLYLFCGHIRYFCIVRCILFWSKKMWFFHDGWQCFRTVGSYCSWNAFILKKFVSLWVLCWVFWLSIGKRETQWWEFTFSPFMAYSFFNFCTNILFHEDRTFTKWLVLLIPWEIFGGLNGIDLFFRMGLIVWYVDFS